MDAYFDWYDHTAIENLQKERANKYLNLVRKWHTAKEGGNKEAMSKASKAMAKHREADQKLKEKADAAGYYWC